MLAVCEEQYPEIEWVMHDRVFENTLDETEKPWQPPAQLDYISWGVQDIGVIQVWETFGIYGQGVLVGMMDSGIDLTHPDLMNKVWINPGEDLNGNGEVDDEERNGIDDDGNGYIDDFHGWNFDGDDNDVMDNHGHGTSTAGIVAGGTSVCDTVGIAPEATLMPLIDHLYQSSMWLGMQYAIDKGVHLISMSVSFKFTECNPTYYECPDPVVWRHINEMELAAGLVNGRCILYYFCFRL
jgi:subtilisin family serine protease